MRLPSLALLLVPLAACWDGLRQPGVPDGGVPDAAVLDAAVPDAAVPDAAVLDAAVLDAAVPDAAVLDAAVPDAAVLDAAVPDAPPDASGSCPLVSGAASPADRVGGTGGGTTTTLTCPAGKVAIGLGITYSDQATSNGGRSAYGVTLACAVVTITTGSDVVTAQELLTATGVGGFGWTPATASAIRTCQTGWVMTGLSAHLGPASNLFANVDIECRKVGVDATFTGPMTTLGVTGSGSLSTNLDAASCPGGAMVGLDAVTGAGLDAVIPSCAALTCAP